MEAAVRSSALHPAGTQSGVALGVVPVVEIALGLFLGLTVLLLEGADDLVAVAFHTGQVIVGEFAPFILKSAFHLFPLAFELVLVHKSPPYDEVQVACRGNGCWVRLVTGGRRCTQMDADGAKLGTAIPNTMQIELHDPTSEALIEKRLASGAYSSAEEVVRRALELLDAEESWTDEERDALYAKITRGLEQLDRGEGIPGEEARRRLQKQKAAWREEHPAPPR